MAESVLSLRPQHPRSRSLEALGETFSLRSSSAGGGTLSGIEITGITMATGEISQGDVFVGLAGKRVHGASYAAAALDAGAVAIITDDAGVEAIADPDIETLAARRIPILVADRVREVLGELAAWVYRTSEEPLLTFGVTGTNGKTSVVYLLSALLEQLGVKSGLSSTAERRIGTTATVSQLTTPEATELHALIARMKEEEVRAVAIEVSAQALTQHRVDGIFFDVVGFANLSHDHLDDYETYDAYFAAKAELFTHERAGRAVVTVDTPWGVKLAAQAKIPVTTLATDPRIAADWRVTITGETPRSTSFTLSSPSGANVSVSVPLLGQFMAANAALAIVMLVEGGFPLADIAAALERDAGITVFIPGRAEIVSGSTGPIFYVDYAHTPDAFASSLASLRRVITGKIVMVFGADGDRDTTKREDMGKIAALGADVVVITDFHPRTEDPAAIRAQLLTGARSAGAASDLYEVADPTQAVRFALTLVGEGDAVLYAGPGHEDYREVAGQHVAYDARDDVRHALRDAGWMDAKTVND